MKQEPLFAGVELGGTKCVCVLATRSGEILEQERVPTTGPDECLPAIKTILQRWFDADASFEALGIAAFGPLEVDPKSPDWGKIGQTPKPGWAGVQVARTLSEGFDVPCALDTDVNGAALAEMRWGAAAGLKDFAYVTVGTGVGVGLICDGKSLGGFGHAEAGHMRIGRVKGDTWEGQCPYHGDCVEGLAAGPAIEARTRLRDPGQLAKDDPVWDYVGHAVAQMLHNLVMIATPRRIFVGGGVITQQPQLFPIIRREFERSVRGYMASKEMNDLDEYIGPPSLGALAGPLGPIALAVGVAGAKTAGKLRLAM